MLIIIFYWFNFFLELVLTSECGPCPIFTKHYQELGCKPLFNNANDCCPSR